jgi:hypothetical protein
VLESKWLLAIVNDVEVLGEEVEAIKGACLMFDVNGIKSLKRDREDYIFVLDFECKAWTDWDFMFLYQFNLEFE